MYLAIKVELILLPYEFTEGVTTPRNALLIVLKEFRNCFMRTKTFSSHASLFSFQLAHELRTESVEIMLRADGSSISFLWLLLQVGKEGADLAGFRAKTF